MLEAVSARAASEFCPGLVHTLNPSIRPGPDQARRRALEEVGQSFFTFPQGESRGDIPEGTMIFRLLAPVRDCSQADQFQPQCWFAPARQPQLRADTGASLLAEPKVIAKFSAVWFGDEIDEGHAGRRFAPSAKQTQRGGVDLADQAGAAQRQITHRSKIVKAGTAVERNGWAMARQWRK